MKRCKYCKVKLNWLRRLFKHGLCFDCSNMVTKIHNERYYEKEEWKRIERKRLVERKMKEEKGE